jgi:hypothetical protein
VTLLMVAAFAAADLVRVLARGARAR